MMLAVRGYYESTGFLRWQLVGVTRLRSWGLFGVVGCKVWGDGLARKTGKNDIQYFLNWDMEKGLGCTTLVHEQDRVSHGFPLKCFLDAYKGYHQVQMAEEDKEKATFYTDRVHTATQRCQAYVDDIVVKSKSKREMLENIAETFNNLRRINMKLNLKKCSFGVEEGNFLGYMVTSESIRANLAKTKDIAEMQSPRTSGEIQSLAGNLAALNQFLSRSAKKSLPFFETLKDITKANKHDYRWTKKAKNAFQELKKMILDLPTLTTPVSKETLFIYLAVSKEAVSAGLLEVRKGNQFLIHYAEYEALLAGLKIAKKIIVQSLSVNLDSKLVASQINGNYEACKENMIRYLSKAKEYISCFKNFKIQNIPRNKNQKADMLSKLVSVAFNHPTKEILVETLDVSSMDVEEKNAVVEEEEGNVDDPLSSPV
nr:reverse transcriptase domain-containing protein [Tanacetum cinerariifolium]